MNKEAPHTRSSMNYSILRISSTSPDAPTAPRFLIPSLVFLLLGKRISLAEWVAPRGANPYASHAVHDRALFLSQSSSERGSSANSMLCLAERLYIRRGHIPLATRSGLTGRVGSARSCESHTIKHTRDICSCSAEELLVPSRQRVVVGAGIMLLGLRRVWHDTHHGGAKRGLRRVKSL